MRFAPVPLKAARGGILAHSLRLDGLHLRKGTVLGESEIAALKRAGLHEVTVALLAPDDLDENTAALRIGSAGAGAGIVASKAFAGRVNLLAASAGVVEISTGVVNAINRLHPAITLATLPPFSRVDKGQMLATIKIIPYGVAAAQVAQAAAQMAGALRLHPAIKKQVSLVMSKVDGMKSSLLDKGGKAVEARLSRLGAALEDCQIVPHEAVALGGAIKAAKGEIVLVLGGSATSDIEDIAPAALRLAGGEVLRFGIPVDPGNLLFLGAQSGRDVLGLPGCVRSMALNGADWVLERLVCGIKVDERMLTGMGVGGLLKEIPTRPQPRRAGAGHGRNVAVILLAAGQSRRMKERDKLLEMVDGQAMLHHAARAALESRADTVFVALPPQADARRARLAGLAVRPIEAVDFAEGMGGSLRNAMAEIGEGYDAVIVALADMPEITPAHYNALIKAYDPGTQREICRAMSEDGQPGHPVLFGQRFFENLAAASGDAGAREILRSSAEFIYNVKTAGRGAVLDLDTPEAWENWRKS